MDKFFESTIAAKARWALLQILCLLREGIGGVKGAAEHIAKRLGRMTEISLPRPSLLRQAFVFVENRPADTALR
ncbi:MAG: hypothetical protein ACLS4Z_04570 [Christensenellaceae bacterium]